jgi:O-antigen/teichoic acid export membrane protein
VQPSTEAPALERMRSKVGRGSLWAVLGYGGGQILRLMGNLVLWRLLDAEAFGLMAIVNVLMLGLLMFSDVGIGPSIIQNEHGEDPKYLHTAWTIQVARGFALFAIAAAAAVPLARFYQEPALAHLIPVVALSSILSGFNSTKLFTVTRRIALGRLTAIDLGSQAAGLAVMVVVAVVTRSIWALVLGGIVTGATRLVLSHAFLPGSADRFSWDAASVRALLRFGRWIFTSTLLTFAAMQSDRLIFGKLVTMSELGVYSIATIWATFPTQILAHVFQSAVFPTLSRLHDQKADLPTAHADLRAPWLMGCGWLTTCLISGGPLLIQFLYDPRAKEAGLIVQVLAAGTWFLALEITNGSALLALGRPKWVAAASAAKLVGMALLIPLGMSLYGFRGAVIAFAASEVFRYAVSALGARTSGLRVYKQDLVLTFAVVSTSIVGLLTAEAVSHLIDMPAAGGSRAGAFVQGTLVFVAVTIAWALVFLKPLWSREPTGSRGVSQWRRGFD